MSQPMARHAPGFRDTALAALLERAWAAFPSAFDSAPLLQQAGEMARAQGDTEAELVVAYLAHYPQRAIDFDNWLPALSQRAQDAGLQRVQWLCRDAQALQATESGRHLEAEALALLNDRLPADARPPIERCLTLIALTYACSWGGRPDEALRHGYRWLAAAERSPSQPMQALALVTLGYIQSSRCSNHDDALVLCQRGWALARQQPFGVPQGNALATLLIVLLRLGRSADALALVREVQATPALRPALALRPSAVVDVLLASGAYDEAEAMLDAAPATEHMTTQQLLRHARVRLAGGRQQYALARKLALQELDTVRHFALPPYEMAQLYDTLREACDALGDAAGAADAAQQAFRQWVTLMEASARARILTQQLQHDPESPAVPTVGNQRRLEMLARQAGAMREQPAQVPAFLAQVVHDMHNPSVGMLHTANALLRSPLDPEQQRRVELLRHAASTLVQLVDDVLDLARLEAGRFTVRAEPFALKAWLSACFEPFKDNPKAQDLRLGLHLHEGLPEMVVGDALRLGQVLSNLLTNAIKFTEQGSVDLVARAQPGRSPGLSQLNLAVIDTGRGIEAAAQPRLFREFEQESPSIAQRYGGTGLGLALSKQLMQAMGGSIHLASEVGRGSVFTVSIELPLAGR